MSEQLMSWLLRPGVMLHGLAKRFPVGSFRHRMRYDTCLRPHYAYCMDRAAMTAEALGIPKLSVLEFGVAGGNGMIAIEQLAAEIEKLYSVQFEIYGFVSGQGLPAPESAYDLPYIWQEGFFAMDRDALERKLSRSQLVFGDVKETVGTFFEQHQPAPIGVVFHDLDYNSSTVRALHIFDAPDASRLPRVLCYFDDIMSSNLGFLCDEVGQLHAIREFNSAHDAQKLAPINGLRYLRPMPARWNEQIYLLHDFSHPQYSTYIHPKQDRQMPIGSTEC